MLLIVNKTFRSATDPDVIDINSIFIKNTFKFKNKKAHKLIIGNGLIDWGTIRTFPDDDPVISFLVFSSVVNDLLKSGLIFHQPRSSATCSNLFSNNCSKNFHIMIILVRPFFIFCLILY